MSLSIIQKAVLVGAFAIAPLSVAQAATVVYTSVVERQHTELSSGPLWLSGFDSSLGTLTGVEVEYGLNIDTSGNLTNTAAQPQNMQVRATFDGYFTFDGPPTIAGMEVVSLDTGWQFFEGMEVGVPYDFGPYALSGSGTITPVDISQFIDTDFSFAVETVSGLSIAGSGGNYGFPQETFGDAYARVTYTYDASPAIPEPATWALMILGFGVTGYAVRRRRKLAAC